MRRFLCMDHNESSTDLKYTTLNKMGFNFVYLLIYLWPSRFPQSVYMFSISHSNLQLVQGLLACHTFSTASRLQVFFPFSVFPLGPQVIAMQKSHDCRNEVYSCIINKQTINKQVNKKQTYQINDLSTFSLSSLTTGFIADSFGSYNPAFCIAGSLQILAVGILFLAHASCQDVLTSLVLL